MIRHSGDIHQGELAFDKFTGYIDDRRFIYLSEDDNRFYREGLNTEYTAFIDMLHKDAQPVFEIPDIDDLLVDYSFGLTFGFFRHNIDDDDKNELHKQIEKSPLHKQIEACISHDKITYVDIVDISYDMSDEFEPKRIYTYQYLEDPKCEGEGTVEEDLIAIPTW